VIYPALMLALNTGMRNAEIRQLRWNEVDLKKQFLTVGRSKRAAGDGRTIPLNAALFDALRQHADWCVLRFGRGKQMDPTRPITTIKTAWTNARQRVGVTGRLHDSRHTLITELAENGAGDQTIMDIAGHVSRQMLKHYSHIRMQAKQEALDVVGKKQQEVEDNNRVEEAKRLQDCSSVSTGA
jgi:integrase